MAAAQAVASSGEPLLDGFPLGAGQHAGRGDAAADQAVQLGALLIG